MSDNKNKFTLKAKDMSRAIGFYKTALGLELLSRTAAQTEMKLGEAIVALFHGNTEENEDNSAIRFEVTDINEACHRARQRGAKIIQSPRDRHEDRVYHAMIEDTEGNHVTLTQDMRLA